MSAITITKPYDVDLSSAGFHHVPYGSVMILSWMGLWMLLSKPHTSMLQPIRRLTYAGQSSRLV